MIQPDNIYYLKLTNWKEFLLHNQTSQTLVIIPIYNDWESVSLLISQVNTTEVGLKFLLVNDGSTQPWNLEQQTRLISGEVSVLHLIRNLGHQRAIATGLSYAYQKLPADNYAIMDGDGEDQLLSLLSMINDLKENSEPQVVFGSRKSRTESLSFKTGYLVYKQLFKMLSGQVISFGHFCVIPQSLLRRVCSVSEIWNHFPAGIIKSKIPFQLSPQSRGSRIDGESKMNTYSLILHGLSAISVFNDTIGVRMVVGLTMILMGGIGALIGTIGMRIWTDYNIPGWTSIIGIAIIIILIQLFSLTVGFIFQILGTRNSIQFIPLKDSQVYVDYLEEIKAD